jgi:signal transduction histidine kinase/PAS domain-containing protein
VLTDRELERGGHLPAIRRDFAGEAVVLPIVRYDATTLAGVGRVTWTQGHFFPVRDAAGAVTGVVLAHVDLTERVEAEEEERAMRVRFEEQATELEVQTAQLQDQAVEMEAQQAELLQQAETLRATNDELATANAIADEARQVAQRAEADVRAILGSIADPFVVHDPEWRFRFVNEAAGRLFAATGAGGAQGLLGRVVWDADRELRGTAFDREMHRARDERVSVTFVEMHAPTGTWSEMRCYPMPDGGLATMWRDSTAQRVAEEAQHFLARASELLSQSLEREETVRALADLLVPQLADWCAVQLVEDGGTLRQVALAHVDPDKVAWARELEVRYPADPSAKTGAHEVVRTGQPILFREVPDEVLVAAARDAEHLRVLREIGCASALVAPLRARGRVLGAMSLIAAESERRYGDAELALAQELAMRAALAIDNAELYGAAIRTRDELQVRTAQAEEARREADAANRAKGDFLATMSHELRTPLNAIGGYAQLLELGVHGPVAEAQLEPLRRIQRSQQHLLSLINDVLNFAKLEAGRVAYDIGRVPVADVLADLEPLVAPQLAAKALRLDWAPVPEALAVNADAEKLQQILLNLLSNAIKFTPDGGSVRVAAQESNDGAVSVTVSDAGIGIPAEKHEAIFEPFVQLARSGASGHAAPRGAHRGGARAAASDPHDDVRARARRGARRDRRQRERRLLRRSAARSSAARSPRRCSRCS